MTHRLDRAEARAIVVRAQLVDAHRPGNLLEVVGRLTLLQIDPTLALHEDVPFTPAMRDAMHEEIHQLAGWLELTV